MTDPRIIVALDFPNVTSTMEFVVKQLDPSLCHVKVGKELFTAVGPIIIDDLTHLGYKVFLDLKYHDIPETVYKAVQAAKEHGVWMLNVHALGGHKMMEAAREAADNEDDRPLIIAVTLLTSLDAFDLNQMQFRAESTPFDIVQCLAWLAQICNVDGVVCSPQEVAELKATMKEPFIYVTPGIRPDGVANDDQKRIMTPRKAIEAGSSYMVLGRPITKSANPRAVLEFITKQIEDAH